MPSLVAPLSGVVSSSQGTSVTSSSQSVSSPPIKTDVFDGIPFSIRRVDGGSGEANTELFRVDANGNVFARGAFHPDPMDLAEYFPLSEAADSGDRRLQFVCGQSLK